MHPCKNIKDITAGIIKDLERTLETSYNFYDFVGAIGDLHESNIVCSEAKFIVTHACASHFLKKFELDILEDLELDEPDKPEYDFELDSL